MKRMSVVLSIAALLLGQVPWATAASITERFDLSAHGFQNVTPDNLSVAPPEPFELSFTVTFDPTLDYALTTSGIFLNSVNVAHTAPLAFTYQKATTQFLVTTYFPTPAPDEPNFEVTFYGLPGHAALVFVRYQEPHNTAGDVLWGTDLGSIAPTILAGVPEPESYALMLAGLSTLAFVAARRRNSDV